MDTAQSDMLRGDSRRGKSKVKDLGLELKLSFCVSARHRSCVGGLGAKTEDGLGCWYLYGFCFLCRVRPSSGGECDAKARRRRG